MSNRKYAALFFLLSSLLFFTVAGIYGFDAIFNHARLAIGQIVVSLVAGGGL
jgi:hypothetical protein